MTVLLQIQNLSHSPQDHQGILSNVNLSLYRGDILTIQGESGSGKSTLLRCIAHLLPYEGEVLYNGSTPEALNIPRYRTAVMYLPQRASLLPGTPREFLHTVCSLKSRRGDKSVAKSLCSGESEGSFLDWNQARVLDLASSWGIDEDLWGRNWTSLSGGEAQRIALAVAVGLNTAEVLLLDEPTSALDLQTARLVEDKLIEEVRSSERNLKALIWVSHSGEQVQRVGSRFYDMVGGRLQERSRLV